MNAFVNGAIAMACVAIGVYFVKFWKRTSDRLFSLFATAFWLLAFDRILTLRADQSGTRSPEEYLARVAAFFVIIAAIVQKNWRKPHR